MPEYDAFLLVSFGGPEGRDDVMPFLRNVTAGRNVPAERLAAVADHYYNFGGVSPINGQCRDLLAAIERSFAAAAIDLPLYWGNRNWHPYLADTLGDMARDGVRHVIAFATSAFSSFSGCRQYLDDIERARAQVGKDAPAVTKIRPYYRQPGFIASFISAAAPGFRLLPDAELVFTAHSVPESMAAASGPSGGVYPAQLAEAAGLVAGSLTAARLGRSDWHLAYQSRSGPPSARWLEPDIGDFLAGLAKDGKKSVVVVPIGFVSDHMEVVHDLDIEAARTADELGMTMFRAATPGTSSSFVSMITDLVIEYTTEPSGPDPLEFCREGCCGSGR
jgi:protoporphyrin/coproporphyrin ferrochelatase